MVNNDFSVCMRKAILYTPCKDCQESTHGEGYFTTIEKATLYIYDHPRFDLIRKSKPSNLRHFNSHNYEAMRLIDHVYL